MDVRLVFLIAETYFMLKRTITLFVKIITLLNLAFNGMLTVSDIKSCDQILLVLILETYLCLGIDKFIFEDDTEYNFEMLIFLVVLFIFVGLI